jgi:Txe/YoeB family toxin of toxin-antitoxin system
MKPFTCWKFCRKIRLKRRPLFEKLVGNLFGFYSRRINIQHRLVYEVIEDIKTVRWGVN